MATSPSDFRGTTHHSAGSDQMRSLIGRIGPDMIGPLAAIGMASARLSQAEKKVLGRVGDVLTKAIAKHTLLAPAIK